MIPLVILGALGTCRDIADTAEDCNRAAGRDVFRVVGFLDDQESLHGRRFLGAEVLGSLECAADYPEASFVNGISSPRSFGMRPAIVARVPVPAERWATLIHPTASVSRSSRLDNGVVLFQNVTVTSQARLEEHVMVLPNSVISHDCRVGAHTTLAGGVVVSGEVTIGRCCYLGAGCLIKNGVTLGEGSLIGMGAVVLRDVPPRSVMVGNPARILRTL